MKKIPKILFIFVLISFLFFLLSYNAVACSESIHDILLECHNKTNEEVYCINEQENGCSILIDASYQTKDGKESEEKTLYISFQNTYTEEEGAQVISWIEQFCVEDIEVIKPVLYDYIKKHEVYVVDDGLFFVPYSEERMKNIENKKNNLTVCEYHDGVKIEDWILLTPQVKSYCYQINNDGGGLCPSYVSIFENKIIPFIIIIILGIGLFIVLYIKRKNVKAITLK